MMRLIVLIALGALLAAATVYGTTIIGMPESIGGNARRLAVEYDGIALADSVEALLSRNGYVDAVATRRADTVYVTPGMRYTLGAVQEGDDSTSAVRVDRPFTPGNLSDGIDMLLAALYDKGRYLASSSVLAVPVIPDS
ncbi:MAG: hypothetical protein ACE5FH_06480, partial [Candidatus Zixiibacteriota bacterium]